MADDLVTIRSFEFLPQAEVAKLHLEEAGITAFIADGETAQVLMGNPVGFVKLQVPGSMVDKATSVLDERSASKTRPKDDSETTRCLVCGAIVPEEEPVCPKCGWSYAAEGDPAS